MIFFEIKLSKFLHQTEEYLNHEHKLVYTNLF